jgi:hypothetical protein
MRANVRLFFHDGNFIAMHDMAGAVIPRRLGAPCSLTRGAVRRVHPAREQIFDTEIAAHALALERAHRGAAAPALPRAEAAVAPGLRRQAGAGISPTR